MIANLGNALLEELQQFLVKFDDFWLFHARGTFKGTIVQEDLDKDLVKSLLPSDFELDDQEVTASDKHPAIFMMGRLKGVHFIDDWETSEWMDLNYREVALIIPYIRWKTDQYPYKGPFAFVPVLYLNKWVPIGLGRLGAYNKFDAKIRMEDFTKYIVNKSKKGSNLLDGEFTFDDKVPWEKPKNVEHFGQLKKMLQQPVVGRYLPEDGRLITSFSLYGCTHLVFDFKKLKMRPLQEASIKLKPDFLPNNSASRNYTAKNEAGKPLRAVQFKGAPFTLNPPLLPEFFVPYLKDQRCVYKPGLADGLGPTRFASQSIGAALDILTGAVNGVAQGAKTIRGNLGAKNYAGSGLIQGLLEGGAVGIEEVVGGLRSARNQFLPEKGGDSKKPTQTSKKPAAPQPGSQQLSPLEIERRARQLASTGSDLIPSATLNRLLQLLLSTGRLR